MKQILNGADQICFPLHGDERGMLVAIEGEGDVPFPIRRIYYISATSKDTVRGKHAHIDLRQVLICVQGSCIIDLDNGTERTSITLTNDGVGIYIHDLMWREMRNFSTDCVLMAIVDRRYSKEDYIFDYKQFIAYAERKPNNDGTVC